MEVLTDHRMNDRVMACAYPGHFMVRLPSGQLRFGIDALFSDRSLVIDACDCDYCRWVPPEAMRSDPA